MYIIFIKEKKINLLHKIKKHFYILYLTKLNQLLM